jgi:hypothetical protein
MVKHIVMFKLTEKSPANLQTAINALNGMQGKIETLNYLEVGVDFEGSQRSYDIVLVTHFADKNGLEAYRTHPNHQPVIGIMQKLCTSSIVVDYETL